MIIVKILGGLGNQLFQYALSRSLSLKNNELVKLDTSVFPYYPPLGTYRLHYFNTVANLAKSNEISRFRKYQRKVGKIWFLYNRLIANESIYIQERQFSFDPNILKIKGSLYLDGWWQSEKYFKSIESIIRKEITLKNEPSLYFTQIARQIKNTNAVSLHIRRCDYVTNEKTNQHHGVCSLSYYQEAIKELTKKIYNPHFFVFSDNIIWAKQNLRIAFPITFVSQKNPDIEYEELIMMSLCKHHIISNSSFSWWGAWLCKNKEKIVFAPKKWFSKPLDTKDLLPDSWIKL